MVQTTEEEFTLSDGKKLYMKKWHPTGSPVAKLILIHGFSDHCNRYYDLLPSLAERGIFGLGFDQRGFGQSVKKPSEKGLTGPTSQVLADIVEVIRAQLPSPVPIFVMGHSMGGGIALTLMSSPKYEDLMPQIRGWILESPYIALAFKPNPVIILAGRLAGKLFPHKQLVQKIPPKDLARDPAVVKSLEEDKLCDGTGTLEAFANMIDRAANLEGGKTRLNKGVQSMVIAHGSNDLATNYKASKKYFEAQTLEDKTFMSYEDCFHQLHSDTPEIRAQFGKDVGDWILARAGGGDAKVQPSTDSKEDGITDAVTQSTGTAVESALADSSSEPAPVEDHARL